MQLPNIESERLATLYKFGVLDTGFEERFDRLTRIAAAVFGTPISLISLVDANRQWFKSAFGLEARETPRDISFCTHAIEATDVFVVCNAKTDARFSVNPLVTGGPNVRFYAGAPLMASNGYALGTFCVVDDKPRSDFPADHKRILRDFAATVVDFFEMKSESRNAQAEYIGIKRRIEERPLVP